MGDALDVAQATTLTAVADSDGDPHLACARRTAATVRVALDIVGQTVVDDVRQVVDVEAASGHVGSDEELKVADAELLHHVVTLCLRELAVQRVGIVAVADQLVGDLLSLLACAAEYDPIDAGVIVCDTL